MRIERRRRTFENVGALRDESQMRIERKSAEDLHKKAMKADESQMRIESL